MAGAGALVAGGHGERAAADIENGLFDGLAEGALQGDGVFQHAEGHLGVVVDLEFQLAVCPVGAVGEEVDTEIADFRQFHVGPVDDFAEEEAGKDSLGTAEERFEGRIVLLRLSSGRRVRGREGNSLGALAQGGFEGGTGLVRLEPAVQDFRGGAVDLGKHPRMKYAEAGSEDGFEGAGDDFLLALLVAIGPTFFRAFEPAERYPEGERGVHDMGGDGFADLVVHRPYRFHVVRILPQGVKRVYWPALRGGI